jgi:hypothetical protein
MVFNKLEKKTNLQNICPIKDIKRKAINLSNLEMIEYQ